MVVRSKCVWGFPVEVSRNKEVDWLFLFHREQEKSGWMAGGKAGNGVRL